MPGTSLAAAVTSTLTAHLTDENGLIILASCTGVPPATASIFARGALCVRNGDGSSGQSVYSNEGTSASPSWALLGATSEAEIALAQNKVLVGNSSGVAAALALATKFLRFTIISGGSAGALTLTGIATGDLILSVLQFNIVADTGSSATGNKVDTVADLTSEFSIAGADSITNASGTATTGDKLLVIWYDLT